MLNTNKTFLFLSILFLGTFNAKSQTGPAGISTTSAGSNLIYWIDANNSVTGTSPITGWSDLSGDAVNNTINGNPVLTTNTLNGYDVITFDGTGDYITTNLSINAGTHPNLTVVAVYTPAVDNAGGVWGEDDAGWDRFILDDVNATINSMVADGTGPVANIPNIFPVATPVISTVIFQEDVVNGTTVDANGTVQSTFTSNQAPEVSNNFAVADIGSLGGAFNFEGDIAEIIVFSSALNNAEKIILENYLSAKYNVGLTSNDLFDEDNPANGNFDHEVAGIGQASNGSNQTDSKGTGIVQISNANDLNNDEFLIWGHDNALLGSFGSTDFPPGLQARLFRTWRASEVNSSGTSVDVGSVHITFDLSTGLGPVTASDLRLLVDQDNDGVFADETPISGAIHLGGDMYQFQNVTAIENNLRFTIGTTDFIQTPLPIELHSFNATPNGNRLVDLTWRTLSETNNDYFEIYKSLDLKNWTFVERIAGAGNSSNPLNYSTKDLSPYQGQSYYKLVQVDLDGTQTNADIKSVMINQGKSSELSIYPNPTSNHLIISGTNAQIESLQLFNSIGEKIEVEILISGNNSAVVNMTNITSGIYFIKSEEKSYKVIKK